MAQDHLGLFDTPPEPDETRFAVAISGLLFAALLLILPVRNVQWLEVVAFIPAIDSLMFVGELITATLLYAQAAVFRSRALGILATGYVFTALLLVPHMLTFPGAFAHDGLLGAGINTTAWIATFRRVSFPIAIILYVQLRRLDLAQKSIDRPEMKVGVAVLAAIALATAVTMLTTLGHDLLPPYFLNRSDVILIHAIAYQTGTLTLFLIATVMLFRARKSVLDTWLLVALSGWLVESVLIIMLPSRFTAGWYGLFVLTLFSHLIVMLALIAETNRLYARLALSTAARSREREARLMTLDALAAAMSHEVGQPLTAVRLNASAGLNWLRSAQPDLGEVAKSLRATLDAGRRTTDVVRSIRDMFAKSRCTVSEFSLNDLIRETVALLERELHGTKILLKLDLDETLPPILADRVQIQRVLVNLFTNAIESLGATRQRARCMALRSARLDDHKVLLEVNDNGLGIAPDQMAHIFDAFFTTKVSGTGLGLSLCRTIVEEQGGQLWASRGKEHGATFHVKLPAR